MIGSAVMLFAGLLVFTISFYELIEHKYLGFGLISGFFIAWLGGIGLHETMFAPEPKFVKVK